MKMTKLLASAAAASLAVTSLATVAAAKDPVEFNMAFPYATKEGSGSFSIKHVVSNVEGAFTVGQSDETILTFDLNQYDDVTGALVKNDNLTINGVQLKIEGTQATKIQDGIVQQTKNLTETFDLADALSGLDADKNDKKFELHVLDDTVRYVQTDAGVLAPGMFYTIDTMELIVSASYKETTYDGDTAKAWWAASNSGTLGFNVPMQKEVEATDDTAGETSKLIQEAFKFGGQLWDGADKYKKGGWIAATYKQDIDYPILTVTHAVKDDVNSRWSISVLSDTDNKMSSSANGFDGDQTKDNLEPYQFAGLASQAADYFNKQTTGTITFFIKAKEASGSGFDWTVGGIPSTEVGFNFLTSSSITKDDMALFFNYKATTGSMVAYAEIDADNNAIVFDITEVLDDFGGLTKATLQDIYYGLRTGWSKTNAIVVEKVVFEADDAAAEAPDADDDAADIGDDDADDDDDATLDDDADDDATADDDADDDTDADDDSNVQGDNTVTDDDDDSNPPTGVALAVIPAMVAGAAAIVAKKRK